MRRPARKVPPLFLRIAIVVGSVSAVAGLAGAVFLHHEVDTTPPDTLHDRPTAYLRVEWQGERKPVWLDSIELRARWKSAAGDVEFEKGGRLDGDLSDTYGFARAPLGIPLTLVMRSAGKVIHRNRFRLQPFHTLIWRVGK